MAHEHPHYHRGDASHISSDPDHDHMTDDGADDDIAGLKPHGKTVIRARAAASGGHSAEKIAAAYVAQGDEVLIGLSHLSEEPPVFVPEGDYGQEVTLSAGEVLDVADGLNMTTADVLEACGQLGIETEPLGLTAPNVISGAEVERLSPADLDAAEAELAASMGASEFGLSAGADQLAADTTQAEIFRYTVMAQRDQLRSAGKRF
jgi:hypothetical protein